MPSIPVMPMFAVPGELPSGSGWAYEFKWNGVRAISAISDGRARFYARNGAEITGGYPELAGLGAIARQAVLDGGIVGNPPAVTYMIFDLLMLDGVDWTGRPYAQRRAALTWLTPGGDHWRVAPSFADGPATVAAATGRRVAGVVAKRLDAAYRPGQRSVAWVEVRPPDRFRRLAARHSGYADA